MTTTATTTTIKATDIFKGMASGATIAGVINYNKLQKGEITKDNAVKNALKIGVQSGIATGASMAATNYYAKNNTMGMLTAISAGIAGIYAVEKVNDMLTARRAPVTNAEEAGE